MRGRHQGGQNGSLAGFIIVGVLLALVLVGGIYGLNRYNASKSSDEIAKTSQQDKKTADIPKDSDQTAKKDTSTKSQPSGSDSSTQATKPSSDNSAASGTNNQQSTQSAVLPHTGPANTLTSMLIVTLFTFVAAHFVQSRVRSLS